MVRAASRAADCRDLSVLFAGVESMADDARGKHDKDDRKLQPTDEAALSARFQRLGERLGSINRGRNSGSQPGSPPASDPSAIARGFRLSVELVAGVLVGAGIGWLLDWWLGISPLGMIVFLLLGFAAGVLNVMRAAGVVPPNKVDPPGSK
jgi:ATP synthase protein I